MIDLVENNSDQPICPHCSTALSSIHFRELRGFLGRRFIYFCPHCKKILGVSHRKGFWMG